VQRPEIVAGRELTVGVARLLPRGVRHDQDEGVQSRVVRFDPLKTLLGDLRGRDFARAEPTAEFLDGHRDSCPGLASDDALTLKSAARTVATVFASASSSGFNSGNPRRSASATALCNHASIFIIQPLAPTSNP
jgi:hypothetical protein